MTPTHPESLSSPASTMPVSSAHADDGTACDHHGCRHERLAAHPRSVARARDSVTAFAVANGASAAQCNAVALAVSEAVTNAILHAYGGGDEHAVVELRTWMQEHCLVALVRDDGVGIGRAGPSDGLGLGLALIARLTDRLTIESPSGTPGTRMRMTFSIG